MMDEFKKGHKMHKSKVKTSLSTKPKRINLQKKQWLTSIDATLLNSITAENEKSQRQMKNITDNNNANVESDSYAAIGVTKPKQLSALQMKFAKKLQGSKFRMINESLYTKTGESSLLEFKKNPMLFENYHEGFREQASQWPENPLHGIISWVNNVIKDKTQVIADMGCGDAELSRKVQNKVYSFDLISTQPQVIAADIAHVPLPDASVDIVVFCLSLMGTNIIDFITEAHRILKMNGVMKIVEVRSRFETSTTSQTTNDNDQHNNGKGSNNSNNKSENKKRRRGGEGIKKFLKIIKSLGFRINNNNSNGNNNGNENNKQNNSPNNNSNKMNKTKNVNINNTNNTPQSFHLNKMFFQVECVKFTNKLNENSLNTRKNKHDDDEEEEEDEEDDDDVINTKSNVKKAIVVPNIHKKLKISHETKTTTTSTSVSTPINKSKHMKAIKNAHKNSNSTKTTTNDNVHSNNSKNKSSSPNLSFSAKACVYKKR